MHSSEWVKLLAWLVCVHRCLGGIRGPSSDSLQQQDFLHRVVLDQMGAFVLLWHPQSDDVIFEVQVKTRGYVGLGFSPQGAMNGADIVIAWVDETGVVNLSDRHGTGNKTPSEDAIQDYKLLGGSFNGTHTVIRFSRPWVTCDKEDDMALSEETIRIIWAYDANLPDPKKKTLDYHDYRGVRSLYLKEPKMEPLPPVALHWDIKSPNVMIPNDLDTVYWCMLFKAPSLSQKHHMIAYEPLINISNEGLVHHMLFYECTLKDSEVHLEKWIGEKGAQCYSQNMPLSWSGCGSPLIAWAIGSKGMTFPDHVGFPIGEEYGGATYFLLEIHYDNPRLKKGIVDDSGLRIYLSDKLRPYDAGVLTVGHVVAPTMIIPPGKLYDIIGHCTGDCTKKGLSPDGINVFSSIMHAHLLASSITVRQIRDGRELSPVAKDRSYDFNFQQGRSISPEKRILPGDNLITTCTYDARRRIVPTFGGLGTKEEMCLTFLHYYPRVDMGECLSSIDMALVFNTFGVEDLYDIDNVMSLFNQEFTYDKRAEDKDDQTLKFMKKLKDPGSSAVLFEMSDFFRTIQISQPPRMKGKTFYDILSDPSVWDDSNTLQRLKDAATKFQFEPKCYYRNRSAIAGVPKKSKYPRYSHLLQHDDICKRGIPNHLLQKPITEVPMDVSALGESKGGSSAQDLKELHYASRKLGRNSAMQLQAKSLFFFTSWLLLCQRLYLFIK